MIRPATGSDLDAAVACLAAAFAHDPITEFLLDAAAGYDDRLRRFFSLLMRARLALGMPVLVAHDTTGIHGAVMGNVAAPPPWPDDLESEWGRLERDIPGFDGRAARYEAIADASRPTRPHYYLGVIGVDPSMHGRGIGTQLLASFCARSDADPRSHGVFLETANRSNVGFYERAGFAVTGEGDLGGATLWCLFRTPDRT